MKAYKCDRCGKYYELEEGKLYYYLGVDINSEHIAKDEKVTFMDLCPKCAESFLKWRDRSRKKLPQELDPAINGGFVFE